MTRAVVLVILVLAGNCWGQDSYTVPLAKINSRLSLPVMVAADSVLYEAHRSFDLLRFSSQRLGPQ